MHIIDRHHAEGCTITTLERPIDGGRSQVWTVVALPDPAYDTLIAPDGHITSVALMGTTSGFARELHAALADA